MNLDKNFEPIRIRRQLQAPEIRSFIESKIMEQKKQNKKMDFDVLISGTRRQSGEEKGFDLIAS